MKIVVLGAGAVGGYFGGRLAEAGADVSFLVREKRREQLLHTGLVINSPFGNLQIPEPKLIVNALELEHCDLVLVGLKNYHLDGALEQIRILAKMGAKVLPIMNGIEHFTRFSQEVGPDNVLGGMCQIISTLDSTGAVQHTSRIHSITFGALLPNQAEFCSQVQKVMEKANFKVIMSDNVLIDIWSKYAFITAYSGTTTACRLPIDQIFSLEPTREVFRNTLQEMWTLARKNQVNLPEAFVDRTVTNTSGYEQGSTSSMHQDFRKGLPLEVESLQGAAVRLANKLNVEVPTVKTLYGLLKPYEQGPRD